MGSRFAQSLLFDYWQRQLFFSIYMYSVRRLVHRVIFFLVFQFRRMVFAIVMDEYDCGVLAGWVIVDKSPSKYTDGEFGRPRRRIFC